MINYKSYYTDIDNVNNYLEEYGVAVIPNILSDSELINTRDQMWNMLEYLTEKLDIPIKSNNTESWKTYYELCPIEDMLLQYWKVGHSQYVWNLRQNINIINIFSKIWNCDINNLLVSFDGISIHFPPEFTNRKIYQEDKDNWYHFDQSSFKKGFHCIQGFINLYDVNKGDSTLSIYEKSHLLHDKFFKHYNKTVVKDWYKLEKDELNFFKDCSEYGVLASAGSLVLWDSRLLHQALVSSKYRLKPNIRSVVYICMMPRIKSNKKQIQRKKQAFKELRMTTHWPVEINRFPSYPKKKELICENKHLINEFKIPYLTPLGERLAGF